MEEMCGWVNEWVCWVDEWMKGLVSGHVIGGVNMYIKIDAWLNGEVSSYAYARLVSGWVSELVGS